MLYQVRRISVMIEITENARTEIERVFAEKEESKDKALRVYVAGYG